ncbi:MAG: hypothetical protein LBD02_03505 [Christensenellaceae bacterium]|jgi:hypothetical protein|nr:hypothetical protein [Christensenellaceae bacterium]
MRSFCGLPLQQALDALRAKGAQVELLFAQPPGGGVPFNGSPYVVRQVQGEGAVILTASYFETEAKHGERSPD